MNFDVKRVALYVVFAFFASQLWAAWQQEQAQRPAQVLADTPALSNAQDLPSIKNIGKKFIKSTSTPAETAPVSGPALAGAAVPEQRVVWVKTDVMRVAIDTLGGNIVRAELLHYPKDKRNPQQPVQILSDAPDNLYLAQSGLLSSRGPDTQRGQAQYQTQAREYTLTPGDEVLDVRLAWRDNNGIRVDKVFTFKRGRYLINVNYAIDNRSNTPWKGNFYTQFKRQDVAPKKQGMFYINPYRGGSYSNPSPDGKVYNKLSFKKMTKNDLSEAITGGWAAMQQHYFLSAWVPPQDASLHYYSKAPRASANQTPEHFILGMYQDALSVAPGQNLSVGSKLFVGPELTDVLRDVAPGLDMTVDYGMLWPISVAIMWTMKKINLFVNNWGWSILLVTLLIKLLFYRLSASTYRSMARQKQLAPRIAQLKQRFGDDKQGFSQAMIALYRTEKVNPLGGCLPMLVQIPVFIALYWVLVESVEFRQAPFILWIRDLSSPDPFYVLPLIMGLTMFVQQKLNPPPPDPMQQKMLMALPIVFTVLFLYFPAGLVLYFAANNALSVLQQWVVMHRLAASGKAKAKAMPASP